MNIDTGDTVRHIPSGETWMVAFVKDGRLYNVGWPVEGNSLSDFELIKSASSSERMNLLTDMSKSSGILKQYAVDRLAILQA